MYGNAVTLPMTEEHPFANRTTYGATKIACEQMCRAAYEQYGLAYVALRCMNVYGPRMDRRGVYVGVIVRMLDDILSGRPPVIYGDGTQTHDFIYVADAARANVLAMLSDAADVPLNVGTGIGTTLNEVADLLLELTGSSLRPERRPEVRSIVTSRVGSTDLARRLIEDRTRAGSDLLRHRARMVGERHPGRRRVAGHEVLLLLVVLPGRRDPLPGRLDRRVQDPLRDRARAGRRGHRRRLAAGVERGLVLLLTLMALIAASQTVFYVEGRHRLILEAAIAALAACGAVTAAGSVRERPAIVRRDAVHVRPTP
ncbi:MAG: NAD-dependent epimerase/dehydratase family protein [Chloroflexi bacterium]|nr:NAD-dependent epimerase/dehydratase family protein [Chloroflexota bacterium]